MKKFVLFAFAAMAVAMQSCDIDHTDYGIRFPDAVVTVIPAEDGGVVLQLDDTTRLYPSNLTTSPYGDREVRALVNYSLEDEASKTVYVNWLDSIRTKKPVETLGAEDEIKYGNDPVEIIRDWVTVAEDGYLTLRVRTLWGETGTAHYLNLVTGTNPDNVYELELRHDAKGDTTGNWGDALIAFNLNDLPDDGDSNVKINLKWKSFEGDKTTEFDLHLRPK